MDGGVSLVESHPRGAAPTPACGRATTRRASGPEGFWSSFYLSKITGASRHSRRNRHAQTGRNGDDGERDTVGVTVVVEDTPNERVTIEASYGTVALRISHDAIADVHRMFLTTPPSILPCVPITGAMGVPWHLDG